MSALIRSHPNWSSRMKTITTLIIFILVLSSCTDETNARRVLESNGYKNITLTGYRPFMRGEDDTFTTGFSATSPSGHHVTGAVTGGPFKGNTIRLD